MCFWHLCRQELHNMLESLPLESRSRESVPSSKSPCMGTVIPVRKKRLGRTPTTPRRFLIFVIQWVPGKMVQALCGSSTTSKPFWLLQCLWQPSMVPYPSIITNCSHWNPCMWTKLFWTMAMVRSEPRNLYKMKNLNFLFRICQHFLVSLLLKPCI